MRQPKHSAIAAAALVAVVAATVGACAATTADPTAAAIDAALAGAHRSEANRARDAWRHPKETLAFFGLRDDMTVLELWPGGGWYTEVLAPVLKDRGQLIAAHLDASASDYAKRSRTAYDAKLAADPATYGKVKVVVLQPPQTIDLGPANSVDMVLTFRNLHNWMQSGQLEQVFIAAHRVLKHGGTFGVVEHRARADADDATVAKSGYVREAYAIQMAERAGFQFVGRSEVNANPRDTKDHPGGVWALPPTLRQGEVDRAKYLAIGESDRMTLKFIKPKGK